jgi:uroporphyrinogen-III synthase
MRLLVTRPEPDNTRSAAALRAAGHEVLLAPMLHIEMADDADLGAPPWSALLLSSANGARAAARHPRRAALMALPVLTVGQGSAEIARSLGFSDVISADGDASDLARLAANRLSGAQSPLLHLAGEDVAGNLAGVLSAQGFAIKTVVAYRAIKARGFDQDTRAALEQGNLDGVLHFSRRSVEAYLDCAGKLLAAALQPFHCAISERAAEPLRKAGAQRIRVAARPDEASLLALVTPKS